MIDALQWGLGLGGLVLIAFGLCWDRPGRRGRAALRCRRCWFDLTGTPEVGEASRASPVVCAECGRAHQSRRQMTRTRRRKRLIATALLLWLIGYSVPVVPAVRDRGWIAAVPGCALVATLPFFSETEETSDKFLAWLNMALQNQGQTAYMGFDTAIYDEINARLMHPSEGLGWPSRRMLFLVGRLENPDNLTNSLTMKGYAYRYLTMTWVRSERVYPFERSWARRQVYFEIEPDLPVYESGRVYGRLRARTLTGEMSHVLVGMGRLNVYPSVSGAAAHSGPIRTPEHYRERVRWDRLVLVTDDDRPIGRNPWPQSSSPLVPLGTVGQNGTAPAWPVTLDARLVLRVDEDRVPLEKSIVIRKDQSVSLPPVDGSVGRKRVIEDRIEPILYAEYDARSNRYLPAFRFDRTNMGNGPRLSSDVIFGGRVELVARISSGQSEGERVIASTNTFSDFVWRLENDAAFEASRQWARPIQPGHFTRDTAIRLRPQGDFNLRRHEKLVRVWVRVQNRWGSSPYPPRDLRGLRGDLIRGGDLEMELIRWSPEEVLQFMISGYVPEHALDTNSPREYR